MRVARAQSLTSCHVVRFLGTQAQKGNAGLSIADDLVCSVSLNPAGERTDHTARISGNFFQVLQLEVCPVAYMGALVAYLGVPSLTWEPHGLHESPVAYMEPCGLHGSPVAWESWWLTWSPMTYIGAWSEVQIACS